jgi:hypothetical protein
MNILSKEEILQIVEASKETVIGYPLSVTELIMGIRQLGELSALGVPPQDLLEIFKRLQSKAIKYDELIKDIKKNHLPFE